MRRSCRVSWDERISIVEDNLQIRQVGRDMLTNLGYEMVIAANGEEAMQHIRDGLRFDLLFTGTTRRGMPPSIALVCAVLERDPSVDVVPRSALKRVAEGTT